MPITPKIIHIFFFQKRQIKNLEILVWIISIFTFHLLTAAELRQKKSQFMFIKKVIFSFFFFQTKCLFCSFYFELLNIYIFLIFKIIIMMHKIKNVVNMKSNAKYLYNFNLVFILHLFIIFRLFWFYTLLIISKKKYYFWKKNKLFWIVRKLFHLFVLTEWSQTLIININFISSLYLFLYTR